MTDLRALFRRPFPEQVAAFRLRLARLEPTRAWDDLAGAEHDRAFMVAGAMRADLLADLAAAVDRAIAEGQGLEAFRDDFRSIVEERGWHGWTGEGTRKGEAWRTRVIYRTNLATTYAAGRWAQLMETGMPLLVYRHGGSLHPRHDHLSWDGLVLPREHPFWATHAPPNGWGCSCYVLGARSERAAARLGGKPGKHLPPGWDRRDPRTGAPPGIDRGWDHAPGAGTADMIRHLTRRAVDWDSGLAGAFMEGLPDAIRDPFSEAYRAQPGLATALRAYWRQVAADAGAAPPARTLGLATREAAARIEAALGETFDGGLPPEFAVEARALAGTVMPGAMTPGGARTAAAGDLGLLGVILNRPDAVAAVPGLPGGGPAVRYDKTIAGERHVAILERSGGRMRLVALWVEAAG